MEWKAISYNLLVSCFLFVSFGSSEATYKVGVGRADCTGPSAEIGFVSIHFYQMYCSIIYKDINIRGILTEKILLCILEFQKCTTLESCFIGENNL